ncbi:MAG: hypothetical protein ABR604_09740 [Jatrophihabitantaceae bacterium]
MNESTVWTAYRTAWRRRPWLVLIVIGAAVLLLVSVVQTFTRGPLAFLFIPGLALGYVHHLIVSRTSLD